MKQANRNDMQAFGVLFTTKYTKVVHKVHKVLSVL